MIQCIIVSITRHTDLISLRRNVGLSVVFLVCRVVSIVLQMARFLEATYFTRNVF